MFAFNFAKSITEPVRVKAPTIVPKQAATFSVGSPTTGVKRRITLMCTLLQRQRMIERRPHSAATSWDPRVLRRRNRTIHPPTSDQRPRIPTLCHLESSRWTQVTSTVSGVHVSEPSNCSDTVYTRNCPHWLFPFRIVHNQCTHCNSRENDEPRKILDSKLSEKIKHSL